MTPGVGLLLTPGACLAGFMKRTMKALSLVVSEKVFYVFYVLAWPVWTPGARLAGFIKRTTIHCYIQNVKDLGLVVSEFFFLCFSHCKSMGAMCCHGN